MHRGSLVHNTVLVLDEGQISRATLPPVKSILSAYTHG